MPSRLQESGLTFKRKGGIMKGSKEQTSSLVPNKTGITDSQLCPSLQSTSSLSKFNSKVVEQRLGFAEWQFRFDPCYFNLKSSQEG
jgi:hypothetical protein